MVKLLKVTLGAAALVALTAGIAGAGANAGATARIGWYNDADPLCATFFGGNYNPTTASTGFVPTFLVTVKGITLFRGADVQIIAEGIGGALPASWQTYSGSPNGCAKSKQSITKGSGYGNCYLSAFDNVAGLAAGQEGQYYNVDNCLTPGGVAVWWLEAVGADVSAVSDPTQEYGLYSVTVAQNNTVTSQCAGNSTHGISPVCIYPWYRLPCNDPGNPRKYVIGVVDQANTFDFAPFNDPSHRILSYNAPAGSNCPSGVSVRQTTWGQLKQMYH